MSGHLLSRLVTGHITFDCRWTGGLCASPGLREDAEGKPEQHLHGQGQPRPAPRGGHDVC